MFNRILKAKSKNNLVNCTGITQIKCDKEYCDNKNRDGICKLSNIRLRQLVNGDYNNYGFFCDSFKCESVIDYKV